MDKNDVIHRLVFYESFIHNFCNKGKDILRDYDKKQLLLARECMMEARYLLKELIKDE